MRIIAGSARGRKILPPCGMETTRPTLDRVKENMFNIIQGYVPYSKAVDVFAGTGSLGLEAVSRGASECYLVDRNPVSFSLLKQNVENLKFEDKCKCINMDSYDALKSFAKEGLCFDLIFIDPPYKKNMIPKAVDIVSENSLLSKKGLIVTKIDYSEEIFEGNDSITMVDHRKYGKTIICLYKYRED